MINRIYYYVQFGQLHVCVTLPAQFVAIKYTLKAIRKTVGHLLTKRASSMLFKARTDMKKDTRLIHNTIAKSLNGNIAIKIFTAQKMNQVYTASI
jgi:hypothetical protein